MRPPSPASDRYEHFIHTRSDATTVRIPFQGYGMAPASDVAPRPATATFNEPEPRLDFSSGLGSAASFVPTPSSTIDVSQTGKEAAPAHHFSDMWKDYYKYLAEEDDDNKEVHEAVDLPLEKTEFEPLFAVGDIVRVQAAPGEPWAQYEEALEGYYSTQKFEIMGAYLMGSGGEVDDNWYRNAAMTEGGIQNINSGSMQGGIRDFNDHATEAAFAAFLGSGAGYWLYRLKPTGLDGPTPQFPMADIMVWKEEHLLFDAEAMDLDADYDDDYEDYDDNHYGENNYGDNNYHDNHYGDNHGTGTGTGTGNGNEVEMKWTQTWGGAQME
ncbi:hypothetical protein A1O3_02122 [Capronia epimyces CBS 606.96]|uniref:Uncharacterized protein n=1 Tax=Capronia epimyces CBS 606.96 TaxID=1182542 RepID=W9Y941_9EURO|nr:uncharacterized protein A1O3_02122 [Capronia epimyces CBS 606.96]EXJ89058.1 hypothetical protein A1O3_02122 [Capronia epimyces CBS 606.96]